MFCVTWSERSCISQETRSLFTLEDDDEETVCDADDVKKLVAQLRGSDVLGDQ